MIKWLKRLFRRKQEPKNEETVYVFHCFGGHKAYYSLVESGGVAYVHWLPCPPPDCKLIDTWSSSDERGGFEHDC